MPYLNFYETFTEIETAVIPRTCNCTLGSPQEPRYVCRGNNCTDPTQGYLSRESEVVTDPVESSLPIDRLLQAEYINGNEPIDELYRQAVKLSNLNLKVDARINELQDLKAVILSLNNIINAKIDDLN